MKNANFGEPPTVQQIIEYLGTDQSKRTVRRKIEQYGYKISDTKGRAPGVIEPAKEVND